MGFYRPSSGRILLNGKDIGDYSTARLSQQIGYLFQNPDSQIFMDSVYEKSVLDSRISNCPKRK